MAKKIVEFFMFCCAYQLESKDAQQQKNIFYYFVSLLLTLLYRFITAISMSTMCTKMLFVALSESLLNSFYSP